MLLRLIFFGLALGAPFLTASALIERTVDRTYPVSGRAVVKVDSFYGEIRVKSGDSPEVKVVVHESMDVKTEDAADRALRDLDLAIDASSSGVVTVRAQTKRSVRWSWEKWPPVVLAIEVSVPKTCDLELLTREGAIVVARVRGDVNVRALQGPIFLGEIDGNVTAWSEQGDVSVTACSAKLNVNAKAGNVVVGRALGQTDITGAGGAVEVQAAKGPLRVTSDGGDLKVGFAYPVNGDAALENASGDILLSFDPKSAVAVDARAASGAKVVARDLPFVAKTGELGSRRFEGTLNSGGPRVAARASTGGIRLLGVPAVSETP